MEFKDFLNEKNTRFAEFKEHKELTKLLKGINAQNVGFNGKVISITVGVLGFSNANLKQLSEVCSQWSFNAKNNELTLFLKNYTRKKELSFLTENVNSFMLSYRTSHAPNDREINHLIGKLGTVTFWDYDGGGSISVMVKFDSSKPLKELQKQLNGTVSKA